MQTLILFMYKDFNQLVTAATVREQPPAALGRLAVRTVLKRLKMFNGVWVVYVLHNRLFW